MSLKLPCGFFAGFFFAGICWHAGALAAEEGALPAEESALPAEEGALPAEEGALPAEESALPAEEGALPAEESADATNSKPLVTIERGALPIILTAPHGGGESIPGVSRRKGEGTRKFNSRSDVGTARLTVRLADALEQRFGKRPYIVVAEFHRRFVDANRPPDLAYEAQSAREFYSRYHDAIAKARREVAERWGHGILLDIHGQAADPQAIFRGTQNGLTTTHLTNRFGRESLTGKTSLFGRLAQQGFRVLPAVDTSDSENPRYNGGFTVGTYGSGHGGTIDAIQLELGRDFRNAAAIESSVNRIAAAMVKFAGDYLPLPKDAPKPTPEPLPVPTPAPARHAAELVHVGVYVDQGVGRSINDLLKVLATFPKLSVQHVTADEIRSGVLSGVDVLIHPGGSGGGQGRHLGSDGRERIRDFISDGGGFIGICAGAYLASADYDWSLHVLDAKVIDRKHWARGQGDVEIGLTKAGQDTLRLKEPRLNIHYEQGPLLAPANRDDIEDYEVIASYETEIAKNGAPKGIMKGTTAIARGQFGQGSVFCFSPHPEKTAGLELLVLHAINEVRKNRDRQAELDAVK